MRAAPRRAFTLVELLLAMALLSILIAALVKLLDTSMTIWGRTEASRDVMELGTSVLDLVARDLSAVEGGKHGDLVCDWMRFDTDNDGIAGTVWPRLRLVRQASPSELARARGGRGKGSGYGRLEVAWALLPQAQTDADRRVVGVLWRGERLPGGDDLSYFDERFFDSTGKPPAGSLTELTGGVLWFQVSFAGQTTVLSDGWRFGSELSHAATSWDAWRRGRPNTELSEYNLPAPGMPRAGGHALLPRRVLVELEIERPAELRRRARLTGAAEPEDRVLRIDNELHLPPEGAFIRVDEEWLRILSIDGFRVSVERAQRETRAVTHAAGALLHHGLRMAREVPIAQYREDWDL